MADEAKAARDALEASRRAAMELVQGAGVARTTKLLGQSAKELEERIKRIAPALGEDSFTIVQLRATLAQVRQVLKEVTLPGLKGIVLDAAVQAAKLSAEHTVEYLQAADKAFRGVGEQPIALRTASMLDVGVHGARASALRRLATGVEARYGKPAGPGILARYGMETVKEFEQTLQVGLIAKKPFMEIREDITRKSPFLQGKPKFWAQRIVRTETMSAYNKSAHESIKQAHEQLGDMLQILSATFDDRTGADSYAVHGQVRRVGEPFESWYGQYEHPPNRPNDREVVVPHRQRWPLPDYLEQLSDDEVEARWAEEGNKKEMPERPLMSTVPGFGEDSE